jgi:hypothetical protein
MFKKSSTNLASVTDLPSRLSCLQCERIFPDKVTGDIEPGGYMLCLVCGHVMTWTEELTLRELTENERIDAGHQGELMRARAKVVPATGVKHRGSWMMTSLFCLIVVMMVLERFHVIRILHHAN